MLQARNHTEIWMRDCEAWFNELPLAPGNHFPAPPSPPPLVLYPSVEFQVLDSVTEVPFLGCIETLVIDKRRCV